MNTGDLVSYFNELLPPSEVKDYSMNGLQVGRLDTEVSSVAFAVDACMAVFQRAAQLGAQMLVVHHGLFWGAPIAVTGSHYDRIRFLIDNNISLYASHLPLDKHSRFGNNAVLAQKLGLQHVEPFGWYQGTQIGYKGTLEKASTLEEICTLLGTAPDQVNALLPFGSDSIKSIGIISGGATKDVVQAIDEGLDLFITGDAKHELYHTCLEAGINMLCAGHYHTETAGVQALAGHISEKFGVESHFINVPTNL